MRELDTSDPSTTDVTWIQRKGSMRKQVRHEWDTNNINARWVWYELTRVVHEQYKCETSATPMTRVRHDWKILILVTTRVKSYLHTPTFTICQGKDYKERSDLMWRRTILSFGNALLPCQSASETCSTETDICNGKSYIKNLYTRLELQMLFNILFSKNYWKLGKVTTRFWKNI